MCTGIIFPGKCGVIEKKNESAGGSDAAMHAPELSGLYFAGMRERVQRMEKGDARISGDFT